MTDNGSGYVAKLFGKVLRLLRIRHIRTGRCSAAIRMRGQRQSR